MSPEVTESEPPKRVIKRYSNRKLYDTKDSRYVTLAQIGDLVRTGEEVQIIDNATKEDKTEATLALIISEEVKSRPKAVPISALRELVHARGEKLLTSLRGGPIGRLFPSPEEEAAAKAEAAAAAASGASPGAPAAATPPVTEAPPAAGAAPAKSAETSKNRLQELVDSSRQTFEEWQAAIDERVKAVMPSMFTAQQDELKKMGARIEALEAKLAALTASATSSGEAPKPEAEKSSTTDKK
jgi:polyhydroxyalkanoate synthesis repressor PhaR